MKIKITLKFYRHCLYFKFYILKGRMSQDKNRRLRRKKKTHMVKDAPFPVPMSSSSGTSNDLCYLYTGYLEGSSVVVRHTGDMDHLYRMGFFGKGSLSRSQPNVNKRCQKVQLQVPAPKDTFNTVTKLVMNKRRYLLHKRYKALAEGKATEYNEIVHHEELQQGFLDTSEEDNTDDYSDESQTDDDEYDDEEEDPELLEAFQILSASNNAARLQHMDLSSSGLVNTHSNEPVKLSDHLQSLIASILAEVAVISSEQIATFLQVPQSMRSISEKYQKMRKLEVNRFKQAYSAQLPGTNFKKGEVITLDEEDSFVENIGTITEDAVVISDSEDSNDKTALATSNKSRGLKISKDGGVQNKELNSYKDATKSKGNMIDSRQKSLVDWESDDSNFWNDNDPVNDKGEDDKEQLCVKEVKDVTEIVMESNAISSKDTNMATTNGVIQKDTSSCLEEPMLCDSSSKRPSSEQEACLNYVQEVVENNTLTKVKSLEKNHNSSLDALPGADCTNTVEDKTSVVSHQKEDNDRKAQVKADSYHLEPIDNSSSHKTETENILQNQEKQYLLPSNIAKNDFGGGLSSSLDLKEILPISKLNEGTACSKSADSKDVISELKSNSLTNQTDEKGKTMGLDSTELKDDTELPGTKLHLLTGFLTESSVSVGGVSNQTEGISCTKVNDADKIVDDKFVCSSSNSVLPEKAIVKSVMTSFVNGNNSFSVVETGECENSKDDSIGPESVQKCPTQPGNDNSNDSDDVICIESQSAEPTRLHNFLSQPVKNSMPVVTKSVCFMSNITDEPTFVTAKVGFHSWGPLVHFNFTGDSSHLPTVMSVLPSSSTLSSHLPANDCSLWKALSEKTEAVYERLYPPVRSLIPNSNSVGAVIKQRLKGLPYLSAAYIKVSNTLNNSRTSTTNRSRTQPSHRSSSFRSNIKPHQKLAPRSSTPRFLQKLSAAQAVSKISSSSLISSDFKTPQFFSYLRVYQLPNRLSDTDLGKQVSVLNSSELILLSEQIKKIQKLYESTDSDLNGRDINSRIEQFHSTLSCYTSSIQLSPAAESCLLKLLLFKSDNHPSITTEELLEARNKLSNFQTWLLEQRFMFCEKQRANRDIQSLVVVDLTGSSDDRVHVSQACLDYDNEMVVDLTEKSHNKDDSAQSPVIADNTMCIDASNSKEASDKNNSACTLLTSESNHVCALSCSVVPSDISNENMQNSICQDDVLKNNSVKYQYSLEPDSKKRKCNGLEVAEESAKRCKSNDQLPFDDDKSFSGNSAGDDQSEEMRSMEILSSIGSIGNNVSKWKNVEESNMDAVRTDSQRPVDGIRSGVDGDQVSPLSNTSSAGLLRQESNSSPGKLIAESVNEVMTDETNSSYLKKVSSSTVKESSETLMCQKLSSVVGTEFSSDNESNVDSTVKTELGNTTITDDSLLSDDIITVSSLDTTSIFNADTTTRTEQLSQSQTRDENEQSKLSVSSASSMDLKSAADMSLEHVPATTHSGDCQNNFTHSSSNRLLDLDIVQKSLQKTGLHVKEPNKAPAQTGNFRCTTQSGNKDDDVQICIGSSSEEEDEEFSSGKDKSLKKHDKIHPYSVSNDPEGTLFVVANTSDEEYDNSRDSFNEDEAAVKQRQLRWRPCIKKDPFPTEETLNLILEEAFFLSYGLGCLRVLDQEQKPLDLTQMWQQFQVLNKQFLPHYVAYHYFRSQGWVPKCGLKFGCDLILYKEGPSFYHGSYSVVVQVVNDDDLQPLGGTSILGYDQRQLSWTSLAALNRSTEQVAKELMLLYVIWPENLTREESLSPDCIPRFRVKELVVSRWVSS